MLGYEKLEALVRAQLPQQEPFVLLGESFSGPIALAIAANPPANLRGLILCASFGASPLAAFKPFAGLMRWAPVRNVPRLLLSWWLLGPWKSTQLELELNVALESVNPQVLKFRAATALRARALDYSHIRLPVLYLRATQDRLLPRSAGERIRGQIPQTRLVEIEGPHLLLQAKPFECARVVSEFAKTLA